MSLYSYGEVCLALVIVSTMLTILKLYTLGYKIFEAFGVERRKPSFRGER